MENSLIGRLIQFWKHVLKHKTIAVIYLEVYSSLKLNG